MKSQNHPNPLTAPALCNLLPGLVHGFMGMVNPAPPFEEVAKQIVHQTYPSHPLGVITLEQPHGPEVLLPDEKEQAPGADGAMLSIKNPGFIVLRTADCVPLLAVDPETGTCAALHAGWRGAAAGILPRLLEVWGEMGSSLSLVKIAIGPSIGPCCYQVGKDCLEEFSPPYLENAISETRTGVHLDLARVLINQARMFGVKETQVKPLNICTDCGGDTPPGFASHRRHTRNNISSGRRNASFIGFLPETL